MDQVENFFCQFPNPWALRVSGMGGYTSKCEKKSKSLHPTVHYTSQAIFHTITLRHAGYILYRTLHLAGYISDHTLHLDGYITHNTQNIPLFYHAVYISKQIHFTFHAIVALDAIGKFVLIIFSFQGRYITLGLFKELKPLPKAILTV